MTTPTCPWCSRARLACFPDCTCGCEAYTYSNARDIEPEKIDLKAVEQLLREYEPKEKLVRISDEFRKLGIPHFWRFPIEVKTSPEHRVVSEFNARGECIKFNFHALDATEQQAIEAAARKESNHEPNERG